MKVRLAELIRERIVFGCCLPDEEVTYWYVQSSKGNSFYSSRKPQWLKHLFLIVLVLLAATLHPLKDAIQAHFVVDVLSIPPPPLHAVTCVDEVDGCIDKEEIK